MGVVAVPEGALVAIGLHTRLGEAAEFTIEGVYLVTDKGLPEASGQQYSLPCGAYFSINKDGKISRVTNYYNLQVQ